MQLAFDTLYGLLQELVTFNATDTVFNVVCDEHTSTLKICLVHTVGSKQYVDRVVHVDADTDVAYLKEHVFALFDDYAATAPETVQHSILPPAASGEAEAVLLAAKEALRTLNIGAYTCCYTNVVSATMVSITFIIYKKCSGTITKYTQDICLYRETSKQEAIACTKKFAALIKEPDVLETLQ